VPKEELIATSFLQIDDPKAKAVQILVAEAHKLHSKALQRLAQEVSAHLGGPFDKIKAMIQKMIFRLMAEQKDEDDHKNWCDMELEKSEESKEDKEGKKEELEKKMDAAEAKTIALAEEISVLQEEVNEIVNHVKEATEIRNTDHEENMATIKDAKDTQDAISSAISVLKDFYKESGKIPKEPWEFVQTGRAPVETSGPPETWDSSYTGLDKEPDGIITLMETISSDFAKMEAETTASEDEDQKAYDTDMTESAINKAEKEKSAEMKGHERARLLDKLKTWTGQLKHVVSELEAVVQYLKDLEPACVNGDSTYEDRKQARADEIEALRKAQGILESAFKAKDEFLQRKADVRMH
jgi:chromosome segregation ATPase